MARKSRDFGHMMASQLEDSFCIVDDFAEHCDEHCDPLVGFGCPSVRDLLPYLTRIEYQLWREVLKGFGIDSLRDLRDCEASLVEYVCGETK